MRRRTVKDPAGDAYWRARLRSPGFARALTALVRDELRALARQRVGSVIDRDQVRRGLREWDLRLVDRGAAVDVGLTVGRAVARRMARRRESLLDLLDPAVLDELDAVVDSYAHLTPRAERTIARVMGQDFMRGLFTDLVYAALVAFYQRVDPLFGGLAVRVLEGQIKSFIRYFTPMVEARATAFVIAPENQRVAAAFARALARQLLATPLDRWAAVAGPAHESAEALARRALSDRRLAAIGRDAMLVVWDELYAAVRERRVGDLLSLERQATWVADALVEALVPLLSRPAVRAFIAAESKRAPTEPGPPRPPPRGQVRRARGRSR